METPRLKYVILLVSDLERSGKFYGETLGFKGAGAVSGEFIFFEAGAGVQLSLRLQPELADAGTTELSFEVQDIQREYDRLRAKGVEFSGPPRVVSPGESADLFATDFRDPDGHLLSLVSWVPKLS